ncbi:MAG: Mov34/MPN/PAD-1 family protein, partial [Myxococcota bacterium]
MTSGAGWTAFGVDISARALAAMRADAEERYPREACGLVFGSRTEDVADHPVALANVAAEPDRFAFDDREHLEVLEKADEAGRVERVLYHSHPDAGAYLSAVDRAAIAPNGYPLMPDLVHLVFEVRRGRCGEVAAYRWSQDRRAFDESRPAPESFPDLEFRGGTSPSPIAPVGGRLAHRRLAPREREALRSFAEGRELRLNREQSERVRDFELGVLSPLTGFQRPHEARIVEALGRLSQGVPWRRPMTLQASLPVGSAGQAIELISSTGEPIGLMVVAEQLGGRGTPGGPLFAYSSGEADVWDLRAGWISMGAEKILAVPSWLDIDLRDLDLEGVDGLLVGGPSQEIGFSGLPVRPL